MNHEIREEGWQRGGPPHFMFICRSFSGKESRLCLFLSPSSSLPPFLYFSDFTFSRSLVQLCFAFNFQPSSPSPIPHLSVYPALRLPTRLFQFFISFLTFPCLVYLSTPFLFLFPFSCFLFSLLDAIQLSLSILP